MVRFPPPPERPKREPAWLDDPSLSVSIKDYAESVKFIADQHRVEQPVTKTKPEPSKKASMF